MGRHDKLLARVLSGTTDTAIRFAELCSLLRHLDFTERQRGSHHIFTHSDLPEILNLQPKGNRTKPYQVKQVREAILKLVAGRGSDDGE